MDIQGKTVLLLGGSGLVGMAVARRVIQYAPGTVVLSALRRDEAEGAVEELRAAGVPEGTRLVPEWGNVFLPEPLKDRSREEVLADPESRALLLDDLLGELTDEVVRRSALGVLLERHRPELVVDCINTATAFAYQNMFASGIALREAAHAGRVDAEAVERHLATLYLPQLIRHVQIALEAMRRAGTRLYVKVGTSGTGGMGLNIPFTHSEERPSRTLLAKAGVAGAHTLLLYLMARTPGGPAVKEIKPTAAISWKAIGYGEIKRGGRPIPRCDAVRPVPLRDAFGEAAADAHRPLDGHLEGVYLDAGENGWFSLAEFETLTALGLMEFITPEEVADNVVREVLGFPTGRDVVAALDATTSGPTYRAGVLRQVALERMEELERQHGGAGVAYEMLGPPRLSKLLFEGAILARLFHDLNEAAALDPDRTAEAAHALIERDHDLRVHALSIGIPVLLPDGERLLRGAQVRVMPEPGQSPADPRLADRGWIDLRPANWARWRARCSAMRREIEADPGPDRGSRSDEGPLSRRLELRPGRLAAWVFRVEDGGRRVRR
ncbi:MAG: short-chain dehydrogenase [bacterium]|jgi:NAD(P)-dependent dehydrogenase (short-subunit alcohol dehydrogenase family)|nr:MAG: short-chain dehydrogenase [bacterium]